MTEQDKLIQLKALLLDEDRVLAEKLLTKLEFLEQEFLIQKNLDRHVGPIIKEKIDAFSEEIPEKLGPTITEALSVQIKNSQDQVVEALFPIIGKMVKRYIQQEIKMLSDNINEKVQSTFSIKTIKRKLKSIFTGVSEKEIILSELSNPEIQQLFIIEKGSGLILTEYVKNETMDKDMLAGMLTAIKCFIEDAIKNKDNQLELIDYEMNQIFLKNFKSYYFAFVLSGKMNDAYKSKLENKIYDFSVKHLKSSPTNKTGEELKAFFKDE